MYRYRLPQILFFSVSLLWFTNTAGEANSSALTQHRPPPENSTPDTDIALKPNPLYYIHHLRFDGNTHLKQKRLRELFQWEPGRAYSRAEIIAGFQHILNAYREAGFVFAEISPYITLRPKHTESGDQTHLVINVEISEGKQIRTGQITLTGNERCSKTEIRDHLGLRPGELFTQFKLEHGIERIQKLYSERGYPKVEIAPQNFSLSPEMGTVNFQLDVQEGPQIQIGDVKISGLKKTKIAVVLREIPVRAKQPFDQRNIDASYRRLRNLGYFYQINPHLLEPGATVDKINFHAHVTEAKTGQLSGVIGYAPSDSEIDPAPRLTGTLEARENNLLGTGRQLNFYWKSGLLKILRLGYAEPWILGKPLTIGIAYGQFKQRNPDRTQLPNSTHSDIETISEERWANVSATTNFGHIFQGIMTLGYKRINLPNTPPSSAPSPPLNEHPPGLSEAAPITSSYSSAKYSLELRLTRDTRDYVLNPTRGRFDSIAVEISHSDFQLRKAQISLQQYLPTWHKQTIALEIHAAAAWGINIPPTELFYLGGATTLRGYDEDWFSGPRRAHATLEYRVLIGPDSQAFVFTDLGTVTSPEKPTLFDKLRIGYGVGTRLESKGGILRINYGLAAGDSLLRGKIHVNLGATF